MLPCIVVTRAMTLRMRSHGGLGGLVAVEQQTRRRNGVAVWSVRCPPHRATCTIQPQHFDEAACSSKLLAMAVIQTETLRRRELFRCVGNRTQRGTLDSSRAFSRTRRVMNWAHENPDRNFSADTPDESKPTSLRDLLKASEVADYFDEMARM